MGLGEVAKIRPSRHHPPPPFSSPVFEPRRTYDILLALLNALVLSMHVKFASFNDLRDNVLSFAKCPT